MRGIFGWGKMQGEFVDPNTLDFGPAMIVRPMPLPPQALYQATPWYPPQFNKGRGTTPTVQIINANPTNRVTI